MYLLLLYIMQRNFMIYGCIVETDESLVRSVKWATSRWRMALIHYS